MNFWGIFRAHNDRLVIGYLMGAEIFGFRQKLGPWQPFKNGNSHLVMYFGGTFFKRPLWR